MNKTVINVPSEIKYIGDWEEFNNIFPMHPHIMNKSVTGCGFTEWCLRNDMNVILCSPRNVLLDNKARQHEGEVYRFRSQYFDKDLDVDRNLLDTREVKLTKPKQEKTSGGKINDEKLEITKQETLNAYQRLKVDLTTYFSVRQNKAKKILVTYDSFHLVRDVLEKWGLIRDYYIIVDEFTSIFTDSRFKATVEISFVGQLRGLDKICYLSATPMMEAYLKEIDEFKNLPYYKLDWTALNPSRIVKPDLTVRVVSSIFKPAKRIIDEYKKGKFKKCFIKDEKTGEIITVESKEVVFFVNSVYNIQNIIKKCDLKPEEVNIICADTDKNKKLLADKLGKKFNIGQIPIKGEPNKMFTFCTRTAYIGADFYSDNARTIVLSDANIDCLAVDISLDLPQIIGRQRLEENPWRNSAEFYYKPLTKNKGIDEKDFKEYIDRKIARTKSLISSWKRVEDDPKDRDALTEVYEDWIKMNNYSRDYLAISKRVKSYPVPVLNSLVMIAEKRAYDIQAKDYKDRITVLNLAFKELRDEDGNSLSDSKKAMLIFDHFDLLETPRDKLKFICSVLEDSEIPEKTKEIVDNNLGVIFRNYLSLGIERLKALNYDTSLIDKDLGVKTFNKSILTEAIFQNFQIGDRYSNPELKKKLGEIYEKIGYHEAPKATDIKNWFKTKRGSELRNGFKQDVVVLSDVIDGIRAAELGAAR